MPLTEQQWCPTGVQVTVQQARGLRIKGKSGTNDAYAVMQVGKEKFQTSVVEKTVAPAWQEEAAFDLPPLLHQDGGGGGKERGTLHVHVLHRALVGPDKLLGQAVVNLLQLGEDKTREKTEWFKLLDKTGKADKDRGEVLLGIQFMRHNMTGSMFDLSATGKSRSRLGKFKDKVRGKKKESDTTSDLVPSFSQVLTESDEEGTGDGEVAAGKGDKKKKHKMKSLFSHKSNLQKNMSQSMSVLTAKNISLSGSQSSGLNVDSSEGKKKFKFLIHKRSNSSDGKDASSGHQKHGAAEPSNVCINGSHVYCEEPPPRASRIGSNFSLASSGHGSMEDVPESIPPSVDSVRVVRQYSPWTEEEEEELENTKEDAGQLRREEAGKLRMEEMRRKEEEKDRVGRKEELERLADEKRRQEQRRTEEENVTRVEEERIRREEEERRQQEEERVKGEQEECDRLAEQKLRLQEQEKLIEEERVRKEEEERIHEERRQKEEEIVRRQEEREEKRRFEEQERSLKEEEEMIRKEEESAREERKRLEEEERVRGQEEECKLAEEKRLEEEKRRIEEDKLSKEERIRRQEEMAEEERERREEEERVRRQEEHKLAEKKRLEEEERVEEDKLSKEEEERIRSEEEMAEEEMMRRQEEKHEEKRRLEEQERRRREHDEKIKEEDEKKARREKEEYERLVEEKRKLEEEERKRIKAEEKIRHEEEERIRVEEERRKEEERVRRQEEHEQLAEEKRILEEQERRIEKQREEEEMRRRAEEENIRKEKEENERLVVEKMRRQEQERRRFEEEEKIKREEDERFKRGEEKIKKEEEERFKREEKIKREEEERFKREEKIKREEEERFKREEKIKREEEERVKREEKIKREEEERVKREEKAEREMKEEEARKKEKEKLTRGAEKQKDNKTKHKAAGKKSGQKAAVESPAEVTSTNPFDENVSNNPFEEIPDSPAGPGSSTAKVPTVQQRVQPVTSSVGSKSASSDEKDPINTQRERRPAPQPPGRNQAERPSQREQDGATQPLAQINKKSKDKDIKTVSVLPQRSVQMIAPRSRSSTEEKNTQSVTQSCATKETSNVVKHGKRTAPPTPRSVEEEPSSEHETALPSDDNISHECGSEAKQVSIVYGLNPFEDNEVENAARDDSSASGNTGSVKWSPVASQAADKDAASQAKTKSSKAHAPPLPAKMAATSSTSIHQNAERGHVADGAGVTVNSVTHHPCDPASEAGRPVRVQEAPLQETVQSAGEDAGGMKVGPLIISRRLQPVKPLNPLEQQSVSVVQGVKDNNSTGIPCEVQVKMKVNGTGLKGPYSQLTQGELISLVLKQEKQLSERDKKIAELEKYIDDLLVRVIEEKPSILMSLNSLKKAT